MNLLWCGYSLLPLFLQSKSLDSSIYPLNVLEALMLKKRILMVDIK